VVQVSEHFKVLNLALWLAKGLSPRFELELLPKGPVMSTATRNYETVFITNPNVAEGKLAEIHNRNKSIIEASKGKILNLDDWGKRKMTFPINKELKGHYFCLTFSADNKCVAEIERNMRINEEVYRFLTVKIDDKVDPMQAIANYKSKLEARARREQERAAEERARKQADDEVAVEAETEE